MLTSVHPKLPMRDRSKTIDYYVNGLGFNINADYGDYLIVAIDDIEIHFFVFEGLNPIENYGQVYIRTNDIKRWYNNLLEKNITIHPGGALESKPWRMIEFSLLDPDNNLLTFGQKQ